MPDDYDAFVSRHPGADVEVSPGVRLHYLDEGSGPPVVMLHGNPSWSFYYRKLVEAVVPAGYRAIVPDHVGCGRSDKPGDDTYDYTLARRVDDLETLLAHLGIDRDITLVMHDWGGGIGSVFAARHPERIARLVILNTAGFHLPKAKSFPWALWLCRDTPLGSFLVRGLNLFAKGTAAIGCKHHTMPRSVKDAYVRPYDSWANRIAVHRFVQDIPLRPGDRMYDTVSFAQDRLSLFAETPAFLGWGLRDFVFDRHFLAAWEKHLPKAEVHRFPKAGHYILEDESEALIPLILDFLARHPLPRASV